MITPLHLLAYALFPRYYREEVLDMSVRVAPFVDEKVVDGCHKALTRLFPLCNAHPGNAQKLNQLLIEILTSLHRFETT